MHARRRAYLERRKKKGAGVDIVPLIDVMFLLLSFFIFVTMSMVIQQEIAVEMAKSETADSPAKNQDPLVVSISREGSFYLNKDKVNEEALSEKLTKGALRNPDETVFINADALAQHRWVIRAMDIIRKSGLTIIVFTTEPEK